MKGVARILVINLAILVVLAGAAAIGYWYWYQGYHYVSTGNASVAAPMATLLAPASGKLSGWTTVMGDSVSAGETMGSIVVSSQTGSTTVPIKATLTGTIGQVDVPNDAVVGAGTPLASVVKTSDLYIIANVPETSIADVSVGQAVDITLSAFPGETFSGRVAQIGPATAGTFSILPQQNTTTNFTPVTQVVPVRITFTHSPKSLGYALRPGESASVTIHIR